MHGKKPTVYLLESSDILARNRAECLYSPECKTHGEVVSGLHGVEGTVTDPLIRLVLFPRAFLLITVE